MSATAINNYMRIIKKNYLSFILIKNISELKNVMSSYVSDKKNHV